MVKECVGGLIIMNLLSWFTLTLLMNFFTLDPYKPYTTNQSLCLFET